MAKYLVITGGSRGIGEKTIERFMEDGWKAVNISRTASPIAGVQHISIDLANAKNVPQQQELLQSALANADHVCLVHNAAYYRPDCVDSLSLDDLHTTLETNIVSAVALNQIIIPLMPAESSILYIGSTLSEKGVPGNASYTISKHALIGLMRSTCQDLMTRRIRSNCVCPGLVDTQLLKATMDPSLINNLLQSKIIGGRLIQPDEIANIIHFCAITPALNGAVIHANLGQVAE